MASQLPSPVAAALGLVPAVLSGVRALPAKAVQLPVLAVSSALSTMDSLRREYGHLADRGERLVSRFRGGAVELGDDISDRADDIEDRVGDLVERTPFAGTQERGGDAAGGVARVLQDAVRPAAAGPTSTAARAGGRAKDTALSLVQTGTEAAAAAADTAAGAVETAADLVEGAAAGNDPGADRYDGLPGADLGEVAVPEAAVPEAEQPKGAPTPRAVEPDSTRVETAAAPSVVAAVEQAAAAAPAAVPEHDHLPLVDYDHMTLGSLRGRLRTLSVEQLVVIRAYEKAHANRLPVVPMLDNRIAKLATDAAATPAGPVSSEPAPEQRAAPAAGHTGPAVSPATSDAPVINPPSQGVPTNPAQPR